MKRINRVGLGFLLMEILIAILATTKGPISGELLIYFVLLGLIAMVLLSVEE